MTRRIIHIEPTEAQWRLIDSISAPHVYQAEGESDISVYDVQDDNHVAVYTVKPDGSYIVESLEDGFNYGWTTFDDEGYELEDGERISDIPHPDWATPPAPIHQ